MDCTIHFFLLLFSNLKIEGGVREVRRWGGVGSRVLLLYIILFSI